MTQEDRKALLTLREHARGNFGPSTGWNVEALMMGIDKETVIAKCGHEAEVSESGTVPDCCPMCEELIDTDD